MRSFLPAILSLLVIAASSIEIKRHFSQDKVFLSTSKEFFLPIIFKENGFYSAQKEKKGIVWTQYVVQSGDNIWSISKRFKIDAATIIQTNLLNSNKLRIGTALKIPNQKGILHKVKKGQTLWDIARAYHISLKKMQEVNDLPTSLVRAGETIFLPGAKPLKAQLLPTWGSSGFIMPCAGRISSRHGWRVHPIFGNVAFHNGVDISAPYGSTVKAAAPGRVIFCGWRNGYGWTVNIRHSGGYETQYAHLSRIIVNSGDYVEQGQRIAAIGMSGQTTGPHLDFEVRKNKSIINPLSCLQ
ncbi:MAG: M23 family metallopeptidase [bacterium]|nr:M23 family metallopeptidase [bacterium]